MGGQLSKTKTEALPMFQGDSNLQHAAETQMSSVSSNSQSSDSTMHLVTDPVFNTIASRVNFRTLSFDSLREVIGSPLRINPEDVQCILDSKKLKWKNQNLFLLVKDYFDRSLLTLNSSNTALAECLKKVRESQKFLQVASQQQLDKKQEDAVDDNKYLATLEALQDFKAAGNPFTENFTQDFLAVCNHQVLMLEKLEPQKNEYGKKVESVKTWKKVSNIIFASTFAATMIFSVVALAMAAPHVVTAGAAVTSIPVGTIGTWINSLWKGYEEALQGRKKLIGLMYAATCIAIKDLEEIRATVNFLSIEIQTLIECIDSALRKEEAVKIVVEEIEKKFEVFFKRIEDLTNQAERCSQDIRRAIKVVLQRVSKHPYN